MNSTRPSPRPPSVADAVRRRLPWLVPILLVAVGVTALAFFAGGGKGKERDDPADDRQEEKKPEVAEAQPKPEEITAQEKKPAPAQGDDKEVIEKLRKLAGVSLEQDEKAKGKPLVRVSMRGGIFSDEHVLMLKGLK